MSKTLKTRPLDVRVHDYKDKGVGVKEHHNHIDRECDLPKQDYHENGVHLMNHEGSSDDICHWKFAYTGKGLCGCKMCTNHIFRKLENRAERHASKQILSKAVDYEDI